MLNYFADIAEERPVIAVIDDAQWLDRATAQTLAFVARRLDSGVGRAVFAVRERCEQLQGLPELVVAGLATADAHNSSLGSPDARRERGTGAVHRRDDGQSARDPRARPHATWTQRLENASERRDPRASGLGSRRRSSGVSKRSAQRRDCLSLIAAADPLGDPSSCGAPRTSGIPARQRR